MVAQNGAPVPPCAPVTAAVARPLAQARVAGRLSLWAMSLWAMSLWLWVLWL